jgi:hypothetical protein
MLSEKSNRFNSKVKCQVYRSLSTQATQQFAHRVIVELASEKKAGPGYRASGRFLTRNRIRFRIIFVMIL